jgi:biotin carboxylase
VSFDLGSGRTPESAAADRLIISYETATTSVFSLKEAAVGLCNVIWLVDLSEPGMMQTARLLRRLGTVVDVCGLSVAQMIDTLGTLGPTGILTVTDRRMRVLAAIAEAFGLRFHSPVVAERISDKFEQRKALQKAGLRVPPFREIPAILSAAEVDELAAVVPYPAVLKPRTGDGSRRVQRIDNPDELLRVIGSPEARSVEPAGWMVEGFLESSERLVSRFADVVSVESFVTDGTVHHLAVTGRFAFAEPFRETGSVLPSDLSPVDAEEATRIAGDAIRALDLRHGCVHTELKFSSDGPFIVEVNGRVGGGIPELIRLAGEAMNLHRFAIELALGRPVSLRPTLHFDRIAYRRIVTAPLQARQITAMSGFDDLIELPGMDEVIINRHPGDQVDWQLGLQELVCSVFGSAESHAAVAEMCDRIDKMVEIEYEGARTVADADVRGATA